MVYMNVTFFKIGYYEFLFDFIHKTTNLQNFIVSSCIHTYANYVELFYFRLVSSKKGATFYLFYFKM